MGWRRNASQLATTLMCLGILAASAGSGRAAEAESRLSPALRESYAAYQSALAERRFGDAHRYARRSVELADGELGRDDTKAAILAYNLGALSLRLERYTDAVKQLEDATARYRLAYGEWSEENIGPLRRLGKAYVALEQWPPAERAWIRAVSTIERSRGRDAPAIAPILFDLIPVAERMEQYKRVKAYGRRAINLYDEQGDEYAVKVGILHLALARNELELGDFSTCKKHMTAASEILEAHLPLGDPQLIALYKFLSQAYEAAGMGNRTHKYKKKLKQNEEAAAQRG